MHEKILKILIMLLIFNIFLFFSGCTENQDTLDPTIQALKDSGKIIVGTSTPYEPMEYIDEDGDIVGYDIDIADAIAKEIGVDVEIKDMDFDDLLDAVANGEIDIAIAAITITIERSEKVLFSNPYLNAGQVIVTTTENEDIYLPSDLLNKTVGVQEGTTSESEALYYTGNASYVIVYDDYSEALNNLTLGSIDAIIIDYTPGVGLIKNISGVEIVGDPFTDEFYGIAIKKGEAALKELIDEVISNLDKNQLEDKWF